MDNTKQESTEQVVYIEEKITKAGSDPIIKKYAKGKMLGKGGFAKCYEVVSLDNKKVLAAKIISKSTLTKSRAKQKLISEIKIHKSLRHINIVGFEHVFEDSENVYILLELCTNQSLHDLLKRRKRLTELETQCYTMQLLHALKYMQSRKVIHRDLKLGNLFLNDKMELKVGDFGLAAKLDFDGEKRRTVCGTPNYIAPEIIEGKNGHSYEVDSWSLGVIIYTLLVGKPPFETADVKLTYKKIKACNYAFPEHVPVSETAKHLVGKLLNLEPSKRPNLDEILNHPFLRNGQNVPKVLPVSTLTNPPSSNFLNQHSSQDNIVKVVVQPQKSLETAPLSIPKTGRYVNALKNNLVSTEKTPITIPQSPNNVKTNENIQSMPNLDKQSGPKEIRGFNLTKSGPWHLSSAQSLNSIGRPHTVQQKDFRSTDRLKTSQGMGILGNVLRVSGPAVGMNRGSLPTTTGQDVWIKKWIDYSSKYGMGYILSNGTAGVFFNDNSKIILTSKSEKFEYIEKNKIDKQESTVSYSLTEFPKELQKKVTLLQHFRNYLDGPDKNPSEAKEIENASDEPGIYVKKWVKAKNATIFRLSNKVVQVNFADKTEILLNSESKVVTYANKKGERNNFPLTSALENGNSEMAKRLKYTKEMLASVLDGNHSSLIPTLHL